MKAKSSPRMQVVKREDKQEKLTSFIISHIDQFNHKRMPGDTHEVQLVALSAVSPVMSALKTAAERIDLSKVHLRLILASIEPTDVIQELAGLPSFSLSWARNARLLDAHEQLVICDTTCWIGDCMRRAPRERDAFECFADDCHETSAWARRSFERLWALSIPLLAVSDDSDADTELLMTLPAQVADLKAAEVFGTRH